MNLRHFQGWALISSGLAMIFLLILKYSSWTNGMPYAREILGLVSSIGLIFGLFGIQSVQPQTKHWGIIGLIFACIPPLQELITTLIFLFATDALTLLKPISSAWDILAAFGLVYLGYIIVGWLTIQARVFPAWIGWSLFIVGIAYDVMWLFVAYEISDPVSFPFSINSIIMLGLMEIAALIGYGVNIIRYRVPKKKRTKQSVQRTAGTRRDL